MCVSQCLSVSNRSNTAWKGIESVQFSIECNCDGMQDSFRNVYTRFRHDIVIGGLLAQQLRCVLLHVDCSRF